MLQGRLTRARIPRTNDYLQAGQRFQLMEEWEQDDLVKNFTDLFAQCTRPVQERMIWHCLMADNELGLRVGEGIGIAPPTSPTCRRCPARPSPRRTASASAASATTRPATSRA
ncbi:catalase-related domain-containing protein [Actinomadura keratinilytica]